MFTALKLAAPGSIARGVLDNVKDIIELPRKKRIDRYVCTNCSCIRRFLRGLLHDTPGSRNRRGDDLLQLAGGGRAERWHLRETKLYERRIG